MVCLGWVPLFTLPKLTAQHDLSSAVGKYNCNECDLCSKRETIKMKNNNILAQ